MVKIKKISEYIGLKYFIRVAILFIIFAIAASKGYQLYLYFSHHINSSRAISRIDYLHNLCTYDKNIKKSNEHYFFQQQELAANAVGKFLVADYHIWGMLFFGQDFYDKDEALYHKMLNQSYEHCPELLKVNSLEIQNQSDSIEHGMIHHIIWFY